MTPSAVSPKHNDRNGWWHILPEAGPPKALAGDHRYRTVIVGAGICGLAAARRLAELRPDERIALVEAERAGFGASGRNAGFMLNLHSHGDPKDIKVLRRNMRLWADGLAGLREQVMKNQIECNWSEWGRLYGSAGTDGEKKIDKIARMLDLLEQPYEWRDRDRMANDLGTGFYLRGLHTPGNALVNPAALMRGLAKNLPVNVDLFEESPVSSWERQGNGLRIELPNGRIVADQVILAAGVFLQHLGVARNRYVPIATYASLSEPLSSEQRALFRIGSEFGLLAASENGATIRLTQDGRLFVRNHFTHAPGEVPSRHAVLNSTKLHYKSLEERWPQLRGLRFEHSWAGVMAFTANDGAVFGEIEKNVFAVLTNDVSPMTRGYAAGRLIAELVEGQDSELLGVQMSIPGARRLPPRPFLDLGVAWNLFRIRRSGKGEL